MKHVRPIDLSVVIANWNTAALLKECLASLTSSSFDGLLEIIIVDNASSDGSVAMVRQEFPSVRLIENNCNPGFARANNQGITESGGRYILLLNSDTVMPSGALAGLVEFMRQHPDAGACSPRLVRVDGKPQEFAFGDDPTLPYLLRRGGYRLLLRRALHDWNTDQVREVDWVSGACLLVRRQAIDQVGLLDENIFMYFEDNDWCLRMRLKGWRIYYNPTVSITHVGSQSLAQNPAARHAYYRSLDHFYAKHYGVFARLLLRVALTPYRLLARC
jgi:GT2 family glycosyltransferase